MWCTHEKLGYARSRATINNEHHTTANSYPALVSLAFLLGVERILAIIKHLPLLRVGEDLFRGGNILSNNMVVA